MTAADQASTVTKIPPSPSVGEGRGASDASAAALPAAIVLPSSRPLPRAVRIRRDRFEAVDLAERSVARAEADALAIRQQAEETAMRLREAARLEGLEEGRRALAVAEVTLRAEGARLRAEAGDRLLRLAVSLAERVLGQELRTHPEAILALVRQALGQLSLCGNAVLRLHPEDARSLTTAYPALASVAQGGAELTLVEDPSLARGDCLVEADGGRVDGSVRVLLAHLEAAMRATLEGPAPDVAPSAPGRSSTP